MPGLADDRRLDAVRRQDLRILIGERILAKQQQTRHRQRVQPLWPAWLRACNQSDGAPMDSVWSSDVPHS
jgi:hypothetical protein